MSLAAARVRTAPVATSTRAGARRASSQHASRGSAAPRRPAWNHRNPETCVSAPRTRDVAARAEFAEIDAESSDAPGGVAEGRFGPDAILLVGFSADETRLWRAELDAIEAGFLRLVTCDDALIDKSLGAALETVQADASSVASAGGIPDRVMFFSGMVGGEIMQLVDLFNGLNIPPSIFACAVPNNWDGKVRDLVSEIADDHRVMMERESAGLEINAEAVNN